MGCTRPQTRAWTPTPQQCQAGESFKACQGQRSQIPSVPLPLPLGGCAPGYKHFSEAWGSVMPCWAPIMWGEVEHKSILIPQLRSRTPGPQTCPPWQWMALDALWVQECLVFTPWQGDGPPLTAVELPGLPQAAGRLEMGQDVAEPVACFMSTRRVFSWFLGLSFPFQACFLKHRCLPPPGNSTQTSF